MDKLSRSIIPSLKGCALSLLAMQPAAANPYTKMNGVMKMRISHITRAYTLPAVAASLLMLVGIPAASAGVLVMADDTFSNSNWTQTATFISSGSTSSSRNQFLTGGNPGAHMRIEHTASGGSAGLQVFTGFSGGIFDPTTQGPLLSIDFTLDNKRFQGFNSGPQFGLGLVQNGRLFTRQTTSGNLGSTSSWQTFAQSGLVESSVWTSYVPSGFSTTITPDFSATGSIIEFGITYGQGNGGAPLTNFIGGFDNWEVTLTTTNVPEPGTVALLGLGLLVLRRRRG